MLSLAYTVAIPWLYRGYTVLLPSYTVSVPGFTVRTTCLYRALPWLCRVLPCYYRDCTVAMPCLARGYAAVYSLPYTWLYRA